MVPAQTENVRCMFYLQILTISAASANPTKPKMKATFFETLMQNSFTVTYKLNRKNRGEKTQNSDSIWKTEKLYYRKYYKLKTQEFTSNITDNDTKHIINDPFSVNTPKIKLI